jgi:hypothetical protein
MSLFSAIFQLLSSLYRTAAYILGESNVFTPLRGVKYPQYGYMLKGEVFNGEQKRSSIRKSLSRFETYEYCPFSAQVFT